MNGDAPDASDPPKSELPAKPPTGPGMVDKARLRERYRALRRGLDPAVVAREAAATADACLDLLERRGITVIASYLAARGELDLDPLHRAWWRSGRALLVPRSLPDGALTWHRIDHGTPLVAGAFGIREPDPAASPAVPLPPEAVVLVPGVAFTADGSRLGQGVGYYDRLLGSRHAAHSPARRGPSIGIGFACQACDHLPTEPHDRPVDALILGGRLLLAPSP